MATPKPSAKPASGARGASADQDTPAPTPAKKRSKRLPLVIVSIVLLLLAGGGGAGAWYFMKDGDSASAGTAADKGKAKGKDTAKQRKPPVFVNLEPFTVNLAFEGSDRYLQTTIVLQMSDDRAAEAMKAYMPLIRNRVLMLLSSKRPSEIEPYEGKQKLVTEIVAAAREMVPGSTPEHGATGALFSSLVIQ